MLQCTWPAYFAAKGRERLAAAVSSFQVRGHSPSTNDSAGAPPLQALSSQVKATTCPHDPDRTRWSGYRNQVLTRCESTLHRCFANPLPSPERCAALLSTSQGFIIGRLGATEARACVNIQARGLAPSRKLGDLSGVYCNKSRSCEPNWKKFAAVYTEAILAVDMLQLVLPACNDSTALFAQEIGLPNVPTIEYSRAMPSWLTLLQEFARRRTPLLIVTPFAESVRRNAGLLDKIHPSHNLAGLNVAHVLRVPQTFTWAPETMGAAADWSSMLELLKKDPVWRQAPDGTVVLLGCGAYGMPLAMHARQIRRFSSMYIGGSLQILFGIRGRRWDERDTTNNFINSHWTRPLPSETPGDEKHRQIVEGASYW